MMSKTSVFSRCLIVGSGPAGYAAAIYAARAALEPTLLQGSQPGGQLVTTTDVENYPGFSSVIQGPWLMQQMEEQARALGVRVVSDMALSVDFSQEDRLRVLGEGQLYEAHAVILATGAQARWLGLPAEGKFLGFGVSACATCDAFFCKEKIVCVVGGGNVAVEEALLLTRFARKVFLIHRRDTLRAEKMLQARLFEQVNNGKVVPIWNSVVEDIVGEERPSKRVTGVRLRDVVSHKEAQVPVDAIFVAIGHTPSTAFLGGKVACDEAGYIIVGHHPHMKTATSVKGVFAAGDVADPIYRQAVTAAGMGCMAALDAEHYCTATDARGVPTRTDT